MGGIFSTAAELEYNAQMGGLPWWVFLIIFIATTMWMANTPEDESGRPNVKNLGILKGSIWGLIITLFFILGDYIRKKMTKARVNLYKNKGYNNLSAQNAALRAAELTNIFKN